MGGKSTCKSLIADIAPQCFSSAPVVETAAVVIQDSCVTLHNLMAALQYDNGSYTVDQIADRFFLPVVHALQGPSMKVHVTLFDKPIYVTMAKQPEQRARDLSRQAADKKRPRDDQPRSKGTIANLGSQLTPRNAGAFRMDAKRLSSDFLHDRSFKYFFTKLLAQRGAELLPEMMRKGGVDPERCAIVDAEFLYSADPQTAEPDGPRVCRTSAIPPSESEHLADTDRKLQVSLRNTLGEFDVAHTHYLRSPVLQCISADDGFLIDTVDTDMLFVTTLQCGIEGYADRIRVRCTLPPGKTKFDFDPRVAHAWITELMPGDAAEQLVEAYTLAGSDFCQGVPGVGNRRFLEDFLGLRGKVTPALYFKRAWGHYTIKGNRRASSTKAAGDSNRQAASVVAQCARASYVVGYWKYSGYHNELVPSPLGLGFGLRGGYIEYAEDIERD